MDYLTKWPEARAIKTADAISVAQFRNTSGNCKDSLREDPRQWVDFSSAFKKEYINPHNNQELKNNLHRNSKKKAFSVTKTFFQYIENRINDYFFGNYNITTVKRDLLENILHYSNTKSENIKKYPANAQFIFELESEPETSSNKRQRDNQSVHTLPNTPKISFKHLQTPEQRTSSKLLLTITSFPASLAQAQIPNSLLNRFARPEDFTSLRSLTKQQEPLQTSSNLLDFLAENQSEHSETAANEENKPEISEKELIDKDIETSPQKWLDQVTKAGDANGWNAARMLKTILYFLKKTAGEWFENLAVPFNDWNAFKAAFLEQFTDNNTSITLRNCFRNIKQELSESVMTYIGKFNKLLRQIRQLETNDYYSDVCPHAPEDLNSAIQHAKRYEMAIEEANHTKLVNLAIGETSSAAEEKIDQLTKKNFHHTALSKGRAAAQQQNPSYTPTTILPARIAENSNLSDIFPFEFEANESPFLLSNTATNKQKAITAMYTKAKVKGKTICLILDSGSAGSIITYQLMQQLKKNVDRPAQIVIVTADGMKKTPVGEIDNFPFTLDGITIPVKVLVMDAPQYQALIGNDWLQKANANLNWKTQELTISYQGQHARVLAICGTFNKHSEKAPAFEFEPEEEKPLIETFMALGSTSNWADKTEQEHFTSHSEPETSGWNISYSKPEPRKQCPYIPLKYILPEKCNWIDVAMRKEVCDQTCQYALLISEKVKRETPFNVAYNSALNKLYHYLHDAEMIFDLVMALINRATKEDVRQIKEAEYIEYTIELAGFNYKDKVEVYHQITSHTYSTQEAQIQ
ncbi:hypothetical protein G9A89_019038 [Geosiphon pyriformis]|nr:hypothetical protein G9A89_019038 [Geosiphon pyriformis]